MCMETKLKWTFLKLPRQTLTSAMVSDSCVSENFSEIVTGCKCCKKKKKCEFFSSNIVNFDHKETCAACYVFLMVGCLCSALDCGC